METLFIYFGKVILGSGVMFLYYKLFLKDKTFHHYNRFYLLATLLIPLVLPLLRVDYFTIEVDKDIFLLLNKLNIGNSTKEIQNDHTYFKFFALGIGLVSVLFLGRLLFGVFKIYRLKKMYPKEELEGIRFYQTDLNDAPFSYFKNLFWKDSILVNSDVGRQILKHEIVHIEQKHSVDKMLSETVSSLFWFNPIFYFVKKEIHLIHEYLADKKSIKNMDTKAFAQMLLASSFSGNRLPATSPFLSSNLKKRLKMLQKPKTKFSYARRIFAMPLVFVLVFAYLVNAKNREVKAINKTIVATLQQIKQDTSKTEIIKPDTIISSKKIVVSGGPEGDVKKISELGKTLQKKTDELKTLPINSKEYQEKADEIGKLGEQIGQIADSEDFKGIVEGKDRSVYSFTLPGNKGLKTDQLAKLLNSPDFKAKFQSDPNFFKSEDWKKYQKEIEDFTFKLPDAGDNDKQIHILKFKNSGFGVLQASYSDENLDKMDKKEAKKLAALQKESAELAKQQAELAKKQAELIKKQFELKKPRIDASNKKFVFKSPEFGEKNVTLFSPNQPLNYNDENVKIYVDGKEVSKDWLRDDDASKISSITVKKKNVDGKMVGEIWVETKK